MPANNGLTRINGKPFKALTNLNAVGECRTNVTLLGEALIEVYSVE